MEVEEVEPFRKAEGVKSGSVKMMKSQRSQVSPRHYSTLCKPTTPKHQISEDIPSKEHILEPVKLKMRVDKSAKVLVSIVILLIVTHSYRLALKMYEVSSPNTNTMESFTICFALKR